MAAGFCPVSDRCLQPENTAQKAAHEKLTDSQVTPSRAADVAANQEMQAIPYLEFPLSPVRLASSTTFPSSFSERLSRSN